MEQNKISSMVNKIGILRARHLFFQLGYHTCSKDNHIQQIVYEHKTSTARNTEWNLRASEGPKIIVIN